MAKGQLQNRVVKSRHGDAFEQNLAIDDNLLPSASELEKLKEIEPEIIQWLLKRTEIEQDSRIEFNKNQLKLTDYNLRKTHNFNYIALIFSFILFIFVLIISAFFVKYELKVQGTIFGGTAIITGLIFFIKVIKK